MVTIPATEWEEVKSTLRSLTKEVQELRAENAALRVENAALRAENAALRAENAALREELAEERRARIAEATENKELRDAVNWLATEYGYINTRIISTSCAVQARSFSTY
jgi:regulator of replication initiation timing